MLVSANKQSLMTPITKKPGEDPTVDAAAGLQSGMLQTLQNNVQPLSAQVQKSATQNATQQVSEATKISDNVDEAFAKTRVGLQFTNAPLPTDAKGKSTGSATDAFKEYMSKTPEERMQEAILEEMGLTKEEVEQMPPEQQQAVAKEMAERMQDKIKLAQAEKENGGSEKGSPQVVDKFLASL
ncbi:hypothetical protein KJF94_19815 [Pseudomonas hormoni]|uniref:Uncharacterized protein n=1 Tax=Pseudomonas hormoni TaxID=3093767 RepID=A0ABX8F4V7_9PSED|nr:hypothetical protein [Pseudomonas hormoni]QVW26949.1 hypothetical protein KJF94_19815 [Pseudomonas hormoni]